MPHQTLLMTAAFRKAEAVFPKAAAAAFPRAASHREDSLKAASLRVVAATSRAAPTSRQ